ncbi:unnamed protein product, partial [Symbiodinium sp. KB8]
KRASSRRARLEKLERGWTTTSADPSRNNERTHPFFRAQFGKQARSRDRPALPTRRSDAKLAEAPRGVDATMLADAARLWRAAGPSLATAVADKLIEDEAKAKAPGASAGAGAGAGTAAEAHAEGSLAAGDDDWMSWDGDATGAPRAEASVGGAGRPAGVPPLALGTAPAPQPLLKDPEFATAAAVVSDVQAAASRGGDAIEDREGLPDPSARPPAGKRRAAKALKRKLVQLQQLRALEQTWDSRATVTRAKDNSSLPLK